MLMKLIPKCMVFGQKWASSLAKSMFSKYNATRLENSSIKIIGKLPNTWTLNSIPLNKHRSNRKSQGKLDNIFEKHKNKTIISKAAINLLLRERSIVLNAYIRNKERSQINNLNLLLKKLEEEDQNKPNARRREKLIKIKAEVNKN